MDRRKPSSRGRRRRAQSRFIVFLVVAVLAIALIAGAIVIALRSRSEPEPAPVFTAQPVETAVNAEPTATTEIRSTLSELLGQETLEIGALPEGAQIKVEDLSVNTELPSEWKNILLLGTDERLLSENSRTDAIIICSVNIETGQVKLISVLRDLAVEFADLGEYSGTYRINAANLFGGPEMVMKVLNERFGMNIENYMTVNFYGFQALADCLGGIDIDISDAEMNQINANVIEQWKAARKAGVDESNLPDPVELTTYGPDTHLDGRQTLGYARIRKIDSDISRAERQRVVLEALAQKLKGKSPMELTALAATLMPYVRTNMSPEYMLSIAASLLSKEFSVEKMSLPVTGTYNPDTRDGESMLYDCDWEANTAELHTFIYGKNQ